MERMHHGLEARCRSLVMHFVTAASVGAVVFWLTGCESSWAHLRDVEPAAACKALEQALAFETDRDVALQPGHAGWTSWSEAGLGSSSAWCRVGAADGGAEVSVRLRHRLALLMSRSETAEQAILADAVERLMREQGARVQAAEPACLAAVRPVPVTHEAGRATATLAGFAAPEVVAFLHRCAAEHALWATQTEWASFGERLDDGIRVVYAKRAPDAISHPTLRGVTFLATAEKDGTRLTATYVAPAEPDEPAVEGPRSPAWLEQRLRRLVLDFLMTRRFG